MPQPEVEVREMATQDRDAVWALVEASGDSRPSGEVRIQHSLVAWRAGEPVAAAVFVKAGGHDELLLCGDSLESESAVSDPASAPRRLIDMALMKLQSAGIRRFAIRVLGDQNPLEAAAFMRRVEQEAA